MIWRVETIHLGFKFHGNSTRSSSREVDRPWPRAVCKRSKVSGVGVNIELTYQPEVQWRAFSGTSPLCQRRCRGEILIAVAHQLRLPEVLLSRDRKLEVMGLIPVRRESSRKVRAAGFEGWMKVGRVLDLQSPPTKRSRRGL